MQMRRGVQWLVCFLGLFFILLSVNPINASMIFFDNFDSENGGNGQLNYTGFANWNVTKGSVDLIGNGFFDLFPGHGLYVDMDGTTSQSGRIETKVPFLLSPGFTYTLQYDLAGNNRGAPANTVQISLGGFSVTHVLPTTLPFTTFTDVFTVGAPIAGNLIVDQIDNNNNRLGALLDNVSLSAVVIPVPPTVFMLGSGLLGLMALGWRKKNL